MKIAFQNFVNQGFNYTVLNDLGLVQYSSNDGVINGMHGDHEGIFYNVRDIACCENFENESWRNRQFDKMG